MLPPERTPRQRIMELLTGTRLSSHQLAQMLDIAARQVEKHLIHVVKTVSRDRVRAALLGINGLMPLFMKQRRGESDG